MNLIFLALVIIIAIAGSGCKTLKTVGNHLDKAAAMAVGPCGQKVAEAAEVCKQQYEEVK